MAYGKILMVAALAVSVAGCDKFKKNKDGDGLGDGPTATAGTNGITGGGTDTITSGALDPNSIDYFKQTIGDRVLFLVDQSSVSALGAQILDRQAAWLAERPALTILIEGHADEQGTREYNLALGARRASAVQNYLVSKGIADSRVKTVTYGKERPLEICSDEACWSKNRRAVTLVAGGMNS